MLWVCLDEEVRDEVDLDGSPLCLVKLVGKLAVHEINDMRFQGFY